MARKRKAAALALLSGYASGSGSGSGGGSESEASSLSESEDAPVLGPAGPPPAPEADAAALGPSAGPAWAADGSYEELPEAPPDLEEEAEAAAGEATRTTPPPEGGEGGGEGAAAPPRPRFVSVPESLAHAQPLPPPPDEPCRPELQAKLARFHALMQSGRSINAELRKSKGYRNPDFLQKIVEHFGIRDTGSGYPKEVFDPEGLPAEDFYDALAAAQRRQAEAREAERSRRAAVEFASGGVQPGTGAHAHATAPVSLRAPLPQQQRPPLAAPVAASLPAARPGRRASRWEQPGGAADGGGLAAAAAAAAAISASLRGRVLPPQ